MNIYGPLIQELEVPDLDEEERPAPTGYGSEEGVSEAPSKRQMKKYDIQLKRFLERFNFLDDNTKALFPLVWGQCTQALQQAIEGNDDFRKKKLKFDSL